MICRRTILGFYLLWADPLYSSNFSKTSTRSENGRLGELFYGSGRPSLVLSARELRDQGELRRDQTNGWVDVLSGSPVVPVDQVVHEPGSSTVVLSALRLAGGS